MPNSVRPLTICTLLLALFIPLLSSNVALAQLGERAEWMRGALGLNWKPARFGDGFAEQPDRLSIEPFLEQIEPLNNVDYIQVHLNESNTFSHSHAAPHARIESMMGDKIIVPRAESNADPFGDWLRACKARNLKTMVYVHSGGLVYGDETIAARWKEYCDTNEEVQEFINSQPWHTKKGFPNRPYMFAYGEFVLKEYSLRYGTLIDAWCFDKAKLVADNGDSLSVKKPNPKKLLSQQRLFENWANACRAGNPDAAVAFNHGVGTAKNPFNKTTLVADFTFGHPFGGIGDTAGTESLYKRNFSFCKIMRDTEGYVFSKDKPTWNDKVIGHFDPKMSTSKWNGGPRAGLTNEQFLEWNEVGLSNGAITWGVPLVLADCNRKKKKPVLTAKPWAFEQLEFMNERITVSQNDE